MLGTAELVEEVNLDGSGKLVKVRIRRSVCTEITAALRDASHLSWKHWKLENVQTLCCHASCKRLLSLCADHRLHQPREDGEHRGARLQQAGDRGGGALHPRCAVRHPLPGQEEVGRFCRVCFSKAEREKTLLPDDSERKNSLNAFLAHWVEAEMTSDKGAPALLHPAGA